MNNVAKRLRKACEKFLSGCKHADVMGGPFLGQLPTAISRERFVPFNSIRPGHFAALSSLLETLLVPN